MENECVIDLIKDFVKRIMYGHYYWQYFSFRCSPYISDRTLKNARKIFAPYDQEKEVPLIFVDSTFLGTGKLGVLITNKAVYFKLQKIAKKLLYIQDKKDLSKLYSLYFKARMSGSLLIINDEEVGICAQFSRGGKIGKEVTVINELLASFIEALKENQ